MTFIVIAAYNEGEQIKNVILELLHRDFKNIVVVDDGSSDNTAQIAASTGAIAIKHPINLGQGAALQTGIDYSLELGADMIVTFDADNQHDPDDIHSAVNTLHKSRCDILLGSRFKGKTINMPLKKRITLKLAIFYTRITTGLDFSDAHNGFRILTKNAAKLIRIKQNRMAHASEILNEIANLKIKYIEHPVTIKYTDYSIAKGQKISNSLNILKDLFLGGLYK